MDSSVLLRYRILFALGGFVYPLWGLLMRWARSGRGHVHFIEDVVIASTCLIGLAATYLSRRVRERVHLLWVVLACLMTAHFFTLVQRVNDPLFMVIGGFVIFQSVVSGFRSAVGCLAYTAFSAALCVWAEQNRLSPWDALFIGGLITSGVVYSIVIWERLRAILSLEHNENILRELNERNAAILRSIHEGFVMIDPELRFRYVNPEAERILGRTRDELIGRRVAEVLPRSAVSTPLARLEMAIARGAPYDYESFNPDLGRWLDARIYPVANGISIFFRDVTEKRKMETQLEEERAKAVVASKMSTLGEMAGGIAHEINNPLAIIHGKAGQLKELAEAGELDSRLVGTAAEKIESTALRISRIVRALRTFARDAEKDPFEKASLKVILDDTLELASQKFRSRGVELRVCHDLDAQIECRPTQIGQVLVNLLSNASDAVETLPEKWVQIDTHVEGDWISIRVTDSGKGISDAIREKMFQPFFTTKEVNRGTGLGLSISRSIAESHHGSLSVDAASSNTCFVLRLPRAQQSVKAA